MKRTTVLSKFINSFLAFSLITLLASASLLVTPLPKALASTATNVTVASTTIALAGQGTTDITINGFAGPPNLAAYDVSIAFNKTKVNVVSVAGGPAPFNAPNANSPDQGGNANTTGVLGVNQFHVTGSGAATIKVATITWTALAGGVHPLTLTITTLADAGPSGAAVTGAVAVNGAITTTTVKSGTGTVNVGLTSDIPITVAGVPAAGLGSYNITVAFDNTKVSINATTGVLDGDATFGAPATKTVGTNTVILADSQTGATPTGDIRVASLRVQGVAVGTFTLTVTINSLTNAAGATLAGTAENGTVTVTALAIESSSVSLNVGVTATSTITVKDFPAPGMKSYNITVSYDSTKVTVASVANGDAPFNAPVSVINNATNPGTVTINQAIAAGFPTGNTIVARLNLTGVANGATNLTIAVTSMTDGADGARTPAITNGTATVTTPVVKTADFSLSVGSSANVNLTVEGLVGQSLKSYNVRITFVTAFITVNAVNPGTAPFNTPTVNINNNAGTVDISQAITAGFPTGNVTVAVINLQGVAATGGGILTLIGTVNGLTNSADATITRTTTNGTGQVFATSVEAGSAFLFKGASADIPITIKQVPTLVAGKGGLGAFNLRIDFDKTKVRVNSVAQGSGLTSGTFSPAPTDTAVIATVNSNGQLVVNWFLGGLAGPVGDLQIARVNVTALADGKTALAIAPPASYPAYAVSDPAGADIVSPRVNGSITAFAVEAGTALARVGATAVIPVTIKVPATSSGLASYGATVGFDKTKIRVDTVADGDAPFGAPTTKTIDNAAGTVTLADSQTGSTPTGNIVVATLNITALAQSVTSLSDTTASPITVNVTVLTDTTSATPTGVPGAGTAGSALIVPVPTVTVGNGPVNAFSTILNLEATVPVTVAVHNSLAPTGIGSYNFSVTFDNTKLTPAATPVTGGAAPFAAAPTVTLPNATTITFSGAAATTPLAQGSFVIANLKFIPIAPGATTTLTLTINSLVDKAAPPNAVNATPANGNISITAPSRPPVAGGGAPPPSIILPPPPPAPPVVTAPVVSSVVVNQGATARDDKGNVAPPSPGQSITISVLDGALTLNIPASTARDATLKTFNDPTSGVTFEGNKLTMPVNDAQGKLLVTITATTGPAQGQGSSAQALVTKLEMQTAPVSSDLSAQEPKVGTVTASVKTELKSLPARASVTVTSAKDPPAAVKADIEQTLARAGNKLTSIGFVTTITPINLDDSRPAAVTFSLKKDWVDSVGGAGNVVITRTASPAEILKTRLVGVQDNIATFEGVSPGGPAGVFALVGLQQPLAVTPTAPPAPAPTVVVTPPAKPTPTPVTPAPKPTAKPTTPAPKPKPATPAPKPTAKPTPPVVVQPVTPAPKPTVVTPPPPPPAPAPAGPNLGMIIGIIIAVIIVIVLVWLIFFRVKK